MAGLKLGASLGIGDSPTGGAMYGSTGAKGKAGPEVITGELLALVVIELLVLGVIRVQFSSHFGG